MTEGAVAAGSPLTVQAGLSALHAGGNAVDGAIAASLMACVAEPLLTGLGGAGLAVLRMDGQVQVCDMFADSPGLGMDPAEPAEMETVELDFGPTTQKFYVGPASVAMPGLPAGLWRLHEKFGRLPMEDLAKPAIRAATDGYAVPLGFERVGRLLWPIQQLSSETAAMFGHEGRTHWRAGEWFRCPALAESIERYARKGPQLFQEGDLGRQLLQTLGPSGRLSPQDLSAYEPRFQNALCCQYRDVRVWVPGPPSVAGLLVLQALRALEDAGPMPAGLSANEVRRLAQAMQRVEQTRDRSFHDQLFQNGFVAGFLDALGASIGGAGHTTHISVVDEESNVVGLTSSLGETAGLCIPGTGITLNNFLGEEDVNPPEHPRPPGERLFTMCCPTIIERGEQVYVMGSGGSSRIRSAVLHGIVYLTDHAMNATEIVQSPRAHVEFGHLHVEADGRPQGALDSLLENSPLPVKRFDGPNMFFGGLHIAGRRGDQFIGAGDARRSGSFDIT